MTKFVRTPLGMFSLGGLVMLALIAATALFIDSVDGKVGYGTELLVWLGVGAVALIPVICISQDPMQVPRREPRELLYDWQVHGT